MTESEKINSEYEVFDEHYKKMFVNVERVSTQLLTYGMNDEFNELVCFVAGVQGRAIVRKAELTNSIVETRQRLEQEAEESRQRTERKSLRRDTENFSWVRGSRSLADSAASASASTREPFTRYQPYSGNGFSSNFRTNNQMQEITRNTNNSSFSSNEGSWRRQSQNI